MGPDRPPYPGLRSFRPDEAEIFFGRDDCIDVMLRRLAATRFLAVLGSSGIGKSSLVKTGLLPALEMGLLRGAGSAWRVVDLRPGQPEGSPLGNLARGLLETSGREATAEDIAGLRAQLMREGPRALLNWRRSAQLPAATNLLLLVDQFEELFRYQDYSSREEAEAFVALLLESRQPLEAGSPEAAELPIYVTLTMRSEFLGACSLIQNLAEAITEGAFLTPRMTREQYREAIVGPAEVCGLAIDERLVNRMLNELAAFAPWDEQASRAQPQLAARSDPLEAQDQVMRLARRADQLPVLQHVLNRMWRRARDRSLAAAADAAGAAPDIELTADDYNEVGGLEKALDLHAESVLAAVSAKLGGGAERTAERLFRALATGASPSEAVRRPTRLEELVAIAEDEAGVRAFVEGFRADECNFLMPEAAVPLKPATMIDISHESLIRQWKRLAQWVVEEAAAAQEWRRLNDYFNNREPLRARTLDNFRAWRKDTQPNAAWASRYGGADYGAVVHYLESAESSRRLRRRLAIGAACATVGVGAIGAWQAWASANEAMTEYKTGVAYETGSGASQSFDQAMGWYQKAAAHGYAPAETNIGYLYISGHGVPQDYMEAMDWYRKAADQGEAVAEYNVGLLYQEGHGAAQDYAQAMRWYRKAADQGNASAETNIGFLYSHGLGVKLDYQQAISWYRKAVAADADAVAQFNIGNLYANGHGLPVNYVEAMSWYRKAAAQGVPEAETGLGDLYEDGHGAPRDYTMAMSWYRKAAAQGLAAAEYDIGALYEDGNGVAQDFAQALSWYQKAAAQGDSEAEFDIGYLYANGRGVPRDYTQAMSWYQKAAAQENAKAEVNIGYLYDRGLGVPQDYAAALSWYRKSAQLGDAVAEYNVGVFYRDGHGAPTDDAQAIAWFRKAADQGYTSAEVAIGRLYANGQGAPRDEAQAQAWFRKAADAGDEEAKRLLAQHPARS